MASTSADASGGDGGSAGDSQQDLPKDGKAIVSMLSQMGVLDYEPAVVNQLLEFVYRYVTDVLDDAKMYAEHAGKNVIDSKDVELAVSMQTASRNNQPPPRDVLLNVAVEKNGTALPALKSGTGLKLPADRYCLLQPNYRLKSSKHILVARPKFNPAALGSASSSGGSDNHQSSMSQQQRARIYPGVQQPHPLIQHQQQQQALMQQGGMASSGATTGQSQMPSGQQRGGTGLFRLVTTDQASLNRKRKIDEQNFEEYDDDE